jgi:hypothetical protein
MVACSAGGAGGRKSPEQSLLKAPNTIDIPRPTIDIPHLKGFVPVRLNGRLELIDSDYYESMVAAGLIPPGSSYQ